MVLPLELLEKQFGNTVLLLAVIKILVKSAVLVGYSNNKRVVGEQISRVMGRQTDPLPHGNEEQGCGKVVHVNVGQLPLCRFLGQEIISGIRAEQLIGIGDNKRLPFQLVGAPLWYTFILTLSVRLRSLRSFTQLKQQWAFPFGKNL